MKVMIRSNNQPDGDAPGVILAGAGLVGLNGFDGVATTRRHMLTLPDSLYGTPGGIAEGLSDVIRWNGGGGGAGVPPVSGASWGGGAG